MRMDYVITQRHDDDGDLDILLSDRKGSDTGIWWLENPGPEKLPTIIGRDDISQVLAKK